MPRQNGIILEKIMEMECMDRCSIIAGAGGIKNTVSNVNIMADPDVMNWVGEGELLLTTAYSFKTSSLEEQKEFIRQCKEKKLAGLAIKIYPYLKELHRDVLKVADELHVPIIELYYEIPFTDIMTPVFKEIFHKQAILLQKLEKIYERLMDVMLKEGDLEAVAKTVNENLKNPVMIILDSPRNQTFYSKKVSEETRMTLIENAETFYNPNRERYKERRLYESRESIRGLSVDRMVMPIVVKNSVFGHIFAWGMSTPLGGFDLSVLEATATTLSLDLLRKLSVKEVENRYRTEFFEGLTSPDRARREKAIEKASVFNLGKDEEYLSIIINFETERKETYSLIEEDLIRMINLSECLIREYEIQGIVISKTDSVILILSFSGKTSAEQKLRGMEQNFKKALESNRYHSAVNIGIGRMYPGIEQFHKSFQDSLKAMRISRVEETKGIRHFEGLGVFKLLSQEMMDEELERFYETTLMPLVEYDQKKSTELVKTLEAYFENNGNFKKISDDIFAHYNTVLYRMQRIREVTGMDLERFDDRLSLEIAVKIKKLLKK